MEDCIVYLVWQLRDAKFEVRFTWPNLLFISWRHHESEYLLKKNPIVQAMTPEPAALAPAAAPPAKRAPRAPAARPPAAAAYTGGFADEIALLTGGSAAGAAPRRAAEYQPPASFIQTLDAPTPRRAGTYPSSGQQPQQPQGGVLSDLWAVR